MASTPVELSLLDLYNRLVSDENDYGAKIRTLYNLYKANESLPDGVTNTYDHPSLWPDNGINVYNIVDTYGMSQSFCTTGVVINAASRQYKFQFMLCESNVVAPAMDGLLFYRFATDANTSTWGWSKWQGIVTYDDVDQIRQSLSTISVDKLKTARKITLAGDVQGYGEFDGSQDITIETQANSNNFIPINIQIDAGTYAVTTYIKLCTLPTSSASTHDQVLITGNIGGWTTDQGKCYVNIVASNRDVPVIFGTAIGTTPENARIVAVKNSNAQMVFYLILNGDVDACTLTVRGDQVTINNTSSTVTPKGAIIWDSNENMTLLCSYASNNTAIADEDTTKDINDPSNSTGITVTPGQHVTGDTLKFTYLDKDLPPKAETQVNIKNAMWTVNKVLIYDAEAITSTKWVEASDHKVDWDTAGTDYEAQATHYITWAFDTDNIDIINFYNYTNDTIQCRICYMY